jgi:hypothetical protein
MEVHVFDTYDAMVAHARAADGPRPAAGEVVGGYFHTGWLAMTTSAGIDDLGIPGMTLDGVLAHECSHQFLHLTLGGSAHVPTWINEALAVHFENAVANGADLRIVPPARRIAQLQERYAQRRQPVAGSVAHYLGHHGGIGADMYGEVYAMLHSFVFGQTARTRGKTGLDRLQEYLGAMRQGEDGDAAFERIFLADMIAAQGGRDQAITAWDAYLVRYVLETKAW